MDTDRQASKESYTHANLQGRSLVALAPRRDSEFGLVVGIWIYLWTATLYVRYLSFYQVSQRRTLIDWFLEGTERHKAHLQCERLGCFSDRQRKVLRERVRELVEEAGGEDDSTVSLSTSESESSLFSSELGGGGKIDWEGEIKLRQEFRVAKSRVFRWMPANR